ncbi:MAG: ABC transporter substrate-binding protein [Actinomycetota bacterium]|nr:ABC transporter substrate-binding protein [Actinomycetota bacterium]
MNTIDRRTFLAGALGAAGAAALGGCSSSSPSSPSSRPTATATGTGQAAARPTLQLAGGDSGFPSPFAYMRGGGYVQMSYLYDTLLWKDSEDEQLPWLAESFEASADGLTYTFELREGVRWHDGVPLTAEDVAFSYEYYAAQKLSPQVIVQPVTTIAEVTATGPTTVVFRLSSPTATFLQFGGAGAVPIVPKHIWSGVSDSAKVSDLAMLVGSGPYRLESYSPGEGSYLYTANDDYFLGRPFVARIENRPVGEQQGAELTALMTGDLAAAGAGGVRPDVLKPFQNDDTFEILEFPPGSSLNALYWNLAKGGALADVKFRQACAMAIDREDLVERLFGGNGTPGNPGFIPPETPFHAEVEQYPFDLAAANAMLDEAGYPRAGGGTRTSPDGGPLSFELLISGMAPVVAVLVSALQQIGVELKPSALDTPSFNQRVIKGETEMSLIGSGGLNSDLAPDYLRLVYNSKTKLTQHAQGYLNPQVDQLTEQQLRTLDVDERKQIVAEIQELVARDLPLLPLYYPGSATIVKPEIFDAWYVTPGGVAGVIPTLNNKQAFITGRKTGTEVRPSR